MRLEFSKGGGWCVRTREAARLRGLLFMYKWAGLEVRESDTQDRKKARGGGEASKQKFRPGKGGNMAAQKHYRCMEFRRFSDCTYGVGVEWT